MAGKKKRYSEWTLIDWDGNPELGLKCWRKSFGRGHVSIGDGDERSGFANIVYSYGPNSDDSCCSTRWRPNKPMLTPQEAMVIVDRNEGKYNPKDNDNA